MSNHDIVSNMYWESFEAVLRDLKRYIGYIGFIGFIGFIGVIGFICGSDSLSDYALVCNKL